MRILSVSLKNFKTHQDSHFEFSAGTNAICGENGAGKTSILEAIAWVLFDYTPYVTDEMICEGASSAEVTVSFVSALEERTYDATRSTTTGYRLYDPQLDRRLEYEKKADVLPWLRQHLGVPIGTDMPKLFSHTIGVPQGTFTADFLKRSQERKKVFDSILKVEEYQAVYKDLLGIEKYGKAQVTEIEHQIDIYATQLKDWDELSTRQQDLTAAIAADTTKLQHLDTQLEQIEKDIVALDAIAARLGETEQQWQELEQKIALATQSVAQKQQAVTEAEAARNRLATCQIGRDAYVQAEAALKHLDEQRQTRQKLQTERETLLEGNRDRQTQLTRLQERLDILARASQEIEALQPQVEQQELLEKQQKDSTAIAAALQELRHERTLMQTRCEEQQERVVHLDKSTAEAQTAREICQQSTAGYEAFLAARDRIHQLETTQHQRQGLLERRAAIVDKLHSHHGDRARLQQQLQRAQAIEGDLQTLQKAVEHQDEKERELEVLQKKYQEFQVLKLKLQQRQQEKQTQQQAIASLTSKLERRQQLQEKVELIPALEGQISRIGSQLARVGAAQQFRSELQTLQTSGQLDLERYRSQLNEFWPVLKPLQQSHPELKSFRATLKDGIAISESLLEQIATILSDLSEQVAVPQLEEQQQSLRSQLQASLQAQVQLQDLAEVTREAQNIEHKLKHIDDDIDDINWQLEAESTHARNLQDLETQIQQLGNPRSRSQLLREELAQYAGIDREWQTLQAKLDAQQQQIQLLDRDLSTTADTPTQLATLQKQRQTHAEAYQRFMQSETLANTLRDRQQAAETAREHLEEQKTRLSTWQQKIGSLESTHGTLDDLHDRQQTLAAQLQNLRDPRQQIARLTHDLKARPSLERECKECERQQESDRKTLKQLDLDLAKFAHLDKDIAAQSALREEHRDTYQQYLVSQPLAATLPERKQVLQDAQQALARQESDRAELATQRSEMAEQYDREQHETLKQTKSLTQQERAAIQARLQTLQPQQLEVAAKLQDLTDIRDRLKEAEKEKKERERVQRFIKYSRSVYKDAGPRITELYQRSVNHEADRLFREILNRPNVSLQWESDYDIAIREGGSKKRRFISLSGGEQMTAALAVRLALLKVLADIDIAFFDEPTTNMDRPRRERLAEAIANIKSFQQLFVISHDDTFETITENVIRVERQN